VSASIAASLMFGAVVACYWLYQEDFHQDLRAVGSDLAFSDLLVSSRVAFSSRWLFE
jgi:hypothetical protein